MSDNEEIKALLREKQLQLEACEARFHNIFTKSADGIVIVDHEGIVQSLNQAAERLFGVKQEELAGRPFAFPVTGGETTDITITTGAGDTVIAEMRVMKTEGKEDRYIFLRDITARKRGEEEIEILHTDLSARAAELETANRELESFSYTVSHDLRAPLTNISGYCQVLLHLCADRVDNECKGFILRVYDEARRMDHLISLLLSFSRLTRCDMHLKEVSLSEIAHTVAAELRQTQQNRRTAFAIADGVMAKGDPRLLRIALENLLGNAWKYSNKREAAKIEFGVRECGGSRSYFVRDNGIGFDMKEADRLFGPFQRLRNATEFDGHGIGLATVQRIIQRHGGQVWAQGEPEKGATFYFTLDAVEDGGGAVPG